jgi:hypothetical protein
MPQQDENLYPLDEQPEEQQQQLQPPVNTARQALLERRQQQQRQPFAAASSNDRPRSGASVGPSSKQQQQRREKPAWQSEPFMAAPASLLRRKRSGVAEAWDVAAAAAATHSERQTTGKGPSMKRVLAAMCNADTLSLTSRNCA